jgi:hypothetical protein
MIGRGIVDIMEEQIDPGITIWICRRIPTLIMASPHRLVMDRVIVLAHSVCFRSPAIARSFDRACFTSSPGELSARPESDHPRRR